MASQATARAPASSRASCRRMFAADAGLAEPQRMTDSSLDRIRGLIPGVGAGKLAAGCGTVLPKLRIFHEPLERVRDLDGVGLRELERPVAPQDRPRAGARQLHARQPAR